MNIRRGMLQEAPLLAAIEAQSYPVDQAASLEAIQNRLAAFDDTFWVLENEEGQICAYISAMATDIKDLEDRMYADCSLCNPNGEWLMIFSVVSHLEYRHQAFASTLMEHVIAASRSCRKGIVLTCLPSMRSFYTRFGFADEGLSASSHGSVTWYQMRLAFD